MTIFKKLLEQQWQGAAAKEIFLRRLIVVVPIMTALAVFVAYIILFDNYSHQMKNISLSHVREYYIKSQKKEEKLKIESVLNWINDEIEQTMKNIDGKNSEKSRKALKSLLLKQIRDVNYSRNGYIFVLTYHGVTLYNPKKSLIGKNNWNIIVGGEKIIQKIIIAALKNRAGSFVEYTGSIEPSTGLPARKISYVVAIPRLRWVVGTGFYINDINAFVAKRSKIINGMIKDSSIKLVFSMIAILLFIFILSILLSNALKNIFIKYNNHMLNRNKLLEKRVRERTSELKLANEKLIAINKKVNIMAITDPLTLLFNRFHLDKQIDNEVDRFQRARRSFALILADIDNFKSINDKYGHSCGDFILVHVAKLMRKCFRKIDTISRWGGEEFLILLPDTDRAGAIVAAEKLRETVENSEIEFKGDCHKITLTAGISVYNDTQISVIDTINKADNAMYRGKLQGRNCVVCSQ